MPRPPRGPSAGQPLHRGARQAAALHSARTPGLHSVRPLGRRAGDGGGANVLPKSVETLDPAAEKGWPRGAGRSARGWHGPRSGPAPVTHAPPRSRSPAPSASASASAQREAGVAEVAAEDADPRTGGCALSAFPGVSGRALLLSDLRSRASAVGICVQYLGSGQAALWSSHPSKGRRVLCLIGGGLVKCPPPHLPPLICFSR
jgi:hypothetical protein